MLVAVGAVGCSKKGSKSELTKKAEPQAASSQPEAAPSRMQRQATSSAASPPVANAAPTAPAKSIEDLKVGEILIQRPKGARRSQLVYAVGSLTNTSNLQRLGVKVELNLLDASGKKVDETSDYQATIAAGETWTFRAVVHDPLAVTAKLARIVEDN